MPDPTQATGLFWATVFGAALGVVAGTLIQYLFTLLLQKQSRTRQKNALMKELFYNRSLFDELADEGKKLRNAVNANVLHTYFGYFSFSRGIFAQANTCANNGVLYDMFTVEDIRHAQHIVSLLSTGNENWVNGEINRWRTLFTTTHSDFNRTEMVAFIDHIERQIHNLGVWIDCLIKKLQQA
jgi:hypothetical protein